MNENLMNILNMINRQINYKNKTHVVWTPTDNV